MVAPDATTSQDPNKGVFAYMRPRPQGGLSGSVECIGDNFPLNAGLNMIAKVCAVLRCNRPPVFCTICVVAVNARAGAVHMQK